MYRNFGHKENAEDLYMHTIAKAWKLAPITYSDTSKNFLNRLLKIAQCKAADNLRTYTRRVKTTSYDKFDGKNQDLGYSVEGADPRDFFGEVEAKDVIDKFGLKDDDKTLLYHMIRGDEHDAIAASMGMNVRTVRTRIFRLRKRLQPLWKEQAN
jgi:DNA-directed RNA polymerase specialized sigma24 family protein